MTLSPRAACRALLVGAACAAAFTASASAGAASRVNGAPGTVLSAVALKRSLWIPGTTARAFKLTYVSTDQLGRRALSTGELFLPKGRAPAGGWRLISWAHGTSGLADGCAPSIVGPAEPKRDFTYLHNWMKEGYAVVASDYVGLGTPGLPAYLGGRSEAHNIVDIVKAGRAFAARRLPANEQLSRRWVVIGQSQGGGAAIYTARYATQFGGRGLDYLGAVGTGVPANVETILRGRRAAVLVFLRADRLRRLHPGQPALLVPGVARRFDPDADGPPLPCGGAAPLHRRARHRHAGRGGGPLADSHAREPARLDADDRQLHEDAGERASTSRSSWPTGSATRTSHTR